MANIVSDSFTGTSGATLQTYNANWVKVSGVTGDITISSDAKAFNNNSGATAAYYRSDATPSSADYSVSADIVMSGNAGATGAPGVTGRASTSANTFYHARIGNTTAELYKFVAGTATLLGSATVPLLTAGQSYNVRLEMVGTAVKVYIDGSATAAISQSDGSITAAGKPGVRALSATNPSLIDTFSADTAGGASSATGTASWTEADDAAAIAGAAKASGSSAWAEADDAAALTGAAKASGAVSWAEADDTAALTGAGKASGPASWAEADDAAAITGNVATNSALASLSWTEADDTAAISGAAKAFGSAAWTEDADTTAITAAVLLPSSGALAWTEQDDAVEISGRSAAQSSMGAGFEMVSIEPAWRKALRIRAEAKERLQVKQASRKAKKRAELIEKLAAKEALSDKPAVAIESRLESLMAEWVELKPSIAIDVPGLDGNYAAFLAQVAAQIERIQQQDDEEAVIALLLM